ncbi:response regulator [Cryomorphaceae bacterium]|nr:response regulator [Cryomorphaceae bacterium]
MSKEIDILKKALERERRARKEAENFLEERSLQLYRTNVELTELNKSLEEKVASRTQELEKQRNFYEAILNNIPADVVVADGNHRYMFINPKAVANKEVRDWMIGKDDFEYVEYRNKPRKIAEERREFFNRVKSARKTLEWTEELEGPKGKEYHLRRWYPVIEDDEIVMYIGYAIEITETVESRLELMDARDIAEKATLAKSEFLSKMSHEIRTPLNAIVGLTDILMQEDLEEEQEHYVHSMKYSADNLLGIVNEILDFSKIEAGKLTFETIPFDLRHSFKGIRQTFEFRLNELGIDFISEIDEDIPSLISGDRVKLNQIFLNLVGNAVKFTERGFIRTTAFLTKEEKDRIWLEFKVQDSGIGISPDRIDHVFDGFEQEGVDTTRKYGGTGLGLTITKKFIEGQGGSIRIESEKGKGSTFIFEMPFGRVSQDVIEASEPVSIEAKLIRPFRLLVAEDNIMNQLVLKKVLEAWNPEVTIVSNGEQALEEMKSNDYDLVFMDIQMPVKGGIETIQEWRKIEKEEDRNHLAVVALTADAFQESKLQALSAGMDDFLSKPIDLTELRRIISTYIGRADDQG